MAQKLKFDVCTLEEGLKETPMKKVRSTSMTQEAVKVPLDLIDPYRDAEGNEQPFQLYGEKELSQLVASVQTYGVLTPVILRPQNGRYQCLAGHNRIIASRMAGLDEIPAVIRSCDDNEAAIIVVDTNLRQRKSLLPSEKAKAYKLKADAMGNRQGTRSDLAADAKQDRAQLIAEECRESKRNVFRYLILNELLPSLLQMVDEGIISVQAGGSVASLNASEQRCLEQVITEDHIGKTSAQQAERMAEISKCRELTMQEIRNILRSNKTAKPQTLTIKVCVDKLLDDGEYVQLKKLLAEQQKKDSFSAHLVEWLEQELTC